MSKHFGKFATEALYNSGISSLDFPNVSLVEQTGNIHYSVALGPKQIWDAAFGDILFYDVDGDTLMTLSDEEYNTTDYPTNKYEPIGVCIYDMKSYGHNKALFISVKYLSNNPNNNSYGALYSGFGLNNVDISQTIPEIRNTTYLNTKEINNKLLEIGKDINPTWKTDSTISTQNNNSYCLGAREAYIFNTNGTQQGEWLIPTYYDLIKLNNNKNDIKSVFSSLKTKYSSNIKNDYSCLSLYTVTECSSTQIYQFNYGQDNGLTNNFQNNKQWGNYAKVVLYVGPEEI